MFTIVYHCLRQSAHTVFKGTFWFSLMRLFIFVLKFYICVAFLFYIFVLRLEYCVYLYKSYMIMDFNLSEVETETLKALAMGCTIREISEDRRMLGAASKSTVSVQKCIAELRVLFKAKNATELIYKAVKKGVI